MAEISGANAHKSSDTNMVHKKKKNRKILDKVKCWGSRFFKYVSICNILTDTCPSNEAVASVKGLHAGTPS